MLLRMLLVQVGSYHVAADLLKAALDSCWLRLIPDERYVLVETFVLEFGTYVVFRTDFPEKLKSLQLSVPESIHGVDNVKSQELSRDKIIKVIKVVKKLNYLTYFLDQPYNINPEGDSASRNPVDVDPPTQDRVRIVTIAIGSIDVRDNKELEAIFSTFWSNLRDNLIFKIHVLEEETLVVFRTEDAYFDLLKDFPKTIAGISNFYYKEFKDTECIKAIKTVPQLDYLKSLLQPRGDLNLDALALALPTVVEEDNISTTSPGTAGSASGSTSTELAANNDHQEIPTAIPEDSDDSACCED